MPELPPPCLKQQELIARTQEHLFRLSELAREEAGMVAGRDEALILEIDKQIENELGEKERSLGALREHRAEHGC